MRKMIISLCMVLAVSLVNAQALDSLRDAYPGMVYTDGNITYYVNDASEDSLVSTCVCRIEGRLFMFQVITFHWDTNAFYRTAGLISIFGGLQSGKAMEIMYKEAEDTELYSGVMYMPVDVQINTTPDYQTITYVYELQSGVDERWCTMMVWHMDGTMLYSGIIGEL